MRFIPPSPYHSRTVLGRIVATVVAAVGLVALAIFGTLALALLAVGGFAWFLWFRWRLFRLRRQGFFAQPSPSDDAARHHDDVIEGDYVVIDERRDGTR